MNRTNGVSSEKLVYVHLTLDREYLDQVSRSRLTHLGVLWIDEVAPHCAYGIIPDSPLIWNKLLAEPQIINLALQDPPTGM